MTIPGPYCPLGSKHSAHLSVQPKISKQPDTSRDLTIERLIEGTKVHRNDVFRLVRIVKYDDGSNLNGPLSARSVGIR